jgi:hypothetical protein
MPALSVVLRILDRSFVNLSEFVTTVIKSVHDLGFPYIVTGSFASMTYSDIRTTKDIDLVVHAPFESIDEFRTKMIEKGFIIPSISPSTDMFNVIHPDTPWKADIILWQDEPFEKERFERRVLVELLPGVNAYIPTVEDMILAKLRWIEGRDSALQLRDIESMIEVNVDSIDRSYLRLWADQLAVNERLEEILANYSPSDS